MTIVSKTSEFFARIVTRKQKPTPENLGCDCSVHDITTWGAAHAVDCPMYD